MLTDIQVRNAKPTVTPRKLGDARGLYLYLSPSGAKSWRFDYRFGGKRCTLTFGRYPDLSLADARTRREEARTKLAHQRNPAQEKQIAKAIARVKTGNTFGAIGDEWYASKSGERSKPWREGHRLYLDRDLSHLARIPIEDVDVTLLLNCLERTKLRSGVKAADRVRQTAFQVFEYAIRELRAKTNPAFALRNWDDVPGKKSHRPLKPAEIAAFLDAVDRYPGFVTTKLAVKLLMLTFVRKVELIEARWEEFVVGQRKWVIPAARMKARQEHTVPLAIQSLKVLALLRPISGGSEYVFPSNSSKDKPMGRSTFNVMFKRMGYGGTFTPHGLRATASTQLNELGFRSDLIERQLAHAERNVVRAAYNNAQYLAERSNMMQAWADWIDAVVSESTQHGIVISRDDVVESRRSDG